MVETVQRVLFLDALGTLVTLEPPAPALRQQLAERFGIEITSWQADRALAAEIAYYRAHLGEGSSPEALADLRRRCAETLRGALPPTPALAAVGPDELTEALLASLRFVAFPDARDAIADAVARGEKVVVVSNWDISLVEVLARVGLAPLLDGIVTSAQVGSRKPSPEIFEHALALAGAEADAARHVGDSLLEDIEGARAAGIEPILIRRDGGDGPAGVRTIASLAELP